MGHNSAEFQHTQLLQMRHMEAMTAIDPRHSLHPWPQTILAMGSATVVQVYCLPWLLLDCVTFLSTFGMGVPMGLGIAFAANVFSFFLQRLLIRA